ncbi:MAG: acyl-CoA synthetase [Paracoccaceae bacterium]
MSAVTPPPVTPPSTRVMNLANFAARSARRFPGRDAYIWGENRWTWREIDARVNAMAHALVTEYGIAKGDRILVQSPNCNQLYETMLACFRIGAIWVPANFRALPSDIEWQAELSGARGMICHADYPGHAAICASRVEFSIAIGAANFGRDYDEIVAAHMGEVVPMAAVDRDDPCWLFFTSGTTGKPKASVLTHGQMGFVITNHLSDLMPGMDENDTAIIIAPLTHAAGLHAILAMARGAASVQPEGAGFDAAEIWRLIDAHNVTNLFAVPTILKMLIEDPAVDQVDHTSLRTVIYAGAPMYRVDQVRALEKLGPVLVQYFGLGEVTGNITVLPRHLHDVAHDARPGTCGFARTGMEIEIQDRDGNAVAPGETGEICVIGPAVFAGYWDNPEANAKAFRNGWFRTGDLGHMDAEGFLYITGRESDMYISGGSNIYPREIEEKLLEHPAIAETAVIGIADEKWGEIGVAICVARNVTAPTETELRDFLTPKIARYKMPRAFHFWSDLPKSGYGKVAKKTVREIFLARRKANHT